MRDDRYEAMQRYRAHHARWDRIELVADCLMLVATLALLALPFAIVIGG